ncbi:MAG: rhodanese-like domain-containing protein [Verrucomicrobiota bacterium]
MIDPNSTLAQVLQQYPGAQRSLFAKYHIGGCRSCSFSPEETLQELCDRNESIPVDEMIDHIVSTHEEDRKILIEPKELEQLLGKDSPPRLLDVRTREEHEAVSIQDSVLFTQDLLQDIHGRWDKEQTVVLYDHQGTRVLDAATFLIGHGFGATRALRGGIDAYSLEVDSSLPRYRVELEE